MNSARQSDMSTLVIQPYEETMLQATTCLLADAYMSNPLNIHAFGEDDFRIYAEFCRLALDSLKGTKVVIIHNDMIVGFMHWAHSSHCQHSVAEKLVLAARMIFHLGWCSAIRISQWLRAWSDHDLQTEHLHLGPIAVDPVMQGHGIGGKLMDHFCQHLDEVRLDGYLETDRKANVRFYHRYGFEVTQVVSVLGVANYLMRRKCNAQSK
jgi:GNAT superfamily N-acetyltransferase